MASGQETSIIPVERIRHCIYLLRGEKVILSHDLSELYGVETRTLIQAIKRNIDRFPTDFMFQLSDDEWESLRSQIVISKGRGGRRYRPYAFTEQGVVMLSSVLNSERAIEVNIAIMRTFVQLRRILADNELLREKIESLEKKYDEKFEQIFTVLQLMLAEDDQPKRQIGYHAEAKRGKMKLIRK